MVELATRSGPAKALAFAILTAARSGEVRGTTWAEVDDADTCGPSRPRMKAGKEHRVPLTPDSAGAARQAGEPMARWCFPAPSDPQAATRNDR